MKKTQFEVEVPTSETKYKEILETPISRAIEGKSTMANNYQFAHGGVRRDIVPPHKYGYIDRIYYDLNVNILQDSKLKTSRELLKGKDIQICLRAVNEDMHSLVKNITLELVRLH